MKLKRGKTPPPKLSEPHQIMEPVSDYRRMQMIEGQLYEVTKRVDLLWGAHTSLYLKGKYGAELVLFDPDMRLTLPENPEEVYQWPWRKVQQYLVYGILSDPGDQDSAVIRANVVGLVRAWKYDRARVDAKERAMEPKPFVAPRKVLLKVGSTKLLITRPVAQEVPVPVVKKMKLIVRKK